MSKFQAQMLSPFGMREGRRGPSGRAVPLWASVRWQQRRGGGSGKGRISVAHCKDFDLCSE